VLVLARADTTFTDGAEATLPPVVAMALVLLEDIVRADAPATLKYFAEQGVAVKVISGDNNVTVGAVARRAGLVGWDDTIDATTLPADDTEAFADAIEHSTVLITSGPAEIKSAARRLLHWPWIT